MELVGIAVNALGILTALVGAILLLRSKVNSAKLVDSWLGVEVGAGQGRHRDAIAYADKYRVYAQKGADWLTLAGAVVAAVGWFLWVNA